MKNALFFCFSFLLSISSFGQSRILKLNPQTGSFKNFPIIPSYEKFTIEGEVLKDIVWVEVDINEYKSTEVDSYFWNRSITNSSSNFEVFVTKGLLGSSKYDFKIRTFRLMDDADKNELLKTMMQKAYSYLDEQIILEKNALKIDKPKQVFDIVEEIIVAGTSLQRSRNGLKLDGLSDLIRQELINIDGTKVSRFFRKKNKQTGAELTLEEKKNKVNYITALILSEVQPFFNSELVQQYRVYEINEAETTKDRFTLPVNAGLYSWTTSADFNKMSAANSGVTPGVGVSFPVFRHFSVRGKKLPSFGISLGVLTSPITNQLGAKLSTPGINIPVYAALGVNFLKVIRVNVGTTVVAAHKSNNVTSLTWAPTIGIAFELDAWLGIRK